VVKKKPKGKPPSFQFYAKDILAHAAREMSLEAFGAYVILLCFAWDSDPIASLPADQEALRRIVGASEVQWASIWQQVSGKFIVHPSDNSRLQNDRLFRQWVELQRFSKSQSERANRRWTKEKPSKSGKSEPNPFVAKVGAE
jgi:uncharacterized protein YdaU (DUF1376 family)